VKPEGWCGWSPPPPTVRTVGIGYITKNGACGKSERTANGMLSNGVSTKKPRLHQCTPVPRDVGPAVGKLMSAAITHLQASGLRAIRSPLAALGARQASGVLEHAPFRIAGRADRRLHAPDVRQQRVVLRLFALKHSIKGPRRQPTRGTSATAPL
jgi:hypothetical protein